MIGMIDRHELFASKKRKSPQIGIYDELNWFEVDSEEERVREIHRKAANKLSYLNGIEVGIFNTFIQNNNALIGAVDMKMSCKYSIINLAELMNSHRFISVIGV